MLCAHPGLTPMNLRLITRGQHALHAVKTFRPETLARPERNINIGEPGLAHFQDLCQDLSGKVIALKLCARGHDMVTHGWPQEVMLKAHRQILHGEFTNTEQLVDCPVLGWE